MVERAADAACEACEQVAICNLDAQGWSEWFDMLRDDRYCYRTNIATHTTALVTCGALSIVGCITSIIPNPASGILCGVGITCFAGALMDAPANAIRQRNEFNRVKDCICAHVSDRANGANPSACSFNCPMY